MDPTARKRFECLFGRRPFKAENPFAAMKLRLEAVIPDPFKISKAIPYSLVLLIKEACARDPAERYQKLGEVMDELSPLAETYDIYPAQHLNRKNQVAALYIYFDESQQTQINRLGDELFFKAIKFRIEVKTLQ